MKIEIEFNKTLDQKVLSQFDPELLKREFEVVYQLQNTIILQGVFKIEANKLLLWIQSRRDEDVYCVFNMTDIKYFIVRQI